VRSELQICFPVPERWTIHRISVECWLTHTHTDSITHSQWVTHTSSLTHSQWVTHTDSLTHSLTHSLNLITILARWINQRFIWMKAQVNPTSPSNQSSKPCTLLQSSTKCTENPHMEAKPQRRRARPSPWRSSPRTQSRLRPHLSWVFLTSWQFVSLCQQNKWDVTKIRPPQVLWGTSDTEWGGTSAIHNRRYVLRDLLVEKPQNCNDFQDDVIDVY